MKQHNDSIGDFIEDVDLYSADLSRWPVEKVKPALSFMEQSAVAKVYFDEALAAENALRGYAPGALDLSLLEEKIMRIVAVTGQGEPKAAPRGFFNFRPSYLFAPGSGLLAAAVIGFIIGIHPAPKPDTLLDPVIYSTAQVTSNDVDNYAGGIF